MGNLGDNPFNSVFDLYLIRSGRKPVNRTEVSLLYDVEIKRKAIDNLFDSMIRPVISDYEDDHVIQVTIEGPFTWEPIHMPEVKIKDYNKNEYWKQLNTLAPRDFQRNVDEEYRITITIDSV